MVPVRLAYYIQREEVTYLLGAHRHQAAAILWWQQRPAGASGSGTFGLMMQEQFNVITRLVHGGGDNV
jgi:hypothetical protein